MPPTCLAEQLASSHLPSVGTVLTLRLLANWLAAWVCPPPFSTNPLLLIVTVVALGKAFHKAHQTGEYAELVDGQFRGAIGAGTTIAAVSVVGVAGARRARHYWPVSLLAFSSTGRPRT